MKIINSTPKKDSFRMPGEFENHSGCWMLWPERTDNWRLNAEPAQKNFAEVAIAISKFEPVTMGVSKSQYFNARNMLSDNIRVVEMPNDDAWARDTGPTFVINAKGKIRGIDWNFNAWGSKVYSSWKKDELVAKKIIDMENVDYYKPDIILEGGSIHVDGEGTLITTEECLLNPNRNPHLSKNQIEQYLKEYLNVEKIIWLKKGIYMDETGGHIDNLCCFVRPAVITLSWTDDKTDPQYGIFNQAYNILKSSLDAKKRKFEIHKIHQPTPKYRTKDDIKGMKNVKDTLPRKEGDKLPNSYINFYIANGGVIMPKFNDEYDESAYSTLQKLFPTRQIIQINIQEIILGGGGIHCITQQIPG